MNVVSWLFCNTNIVLNTLIIDDKTFNDNLTGKIWARYEWKTKLLHFLIRSRLSDTGTNSHNIKAAGLRYEIWITIRNDETVCGHGGYPCGASKLFGSKGKNIGR